MHKEDDKHTYFFISLKLIILMTDEALKLVQSKMKLWPYYTNVYYKYTHGFLKGMGGLSLSTRYLGHC
jgi:hypothetical protein